MARRLVLLTLGVLLLVAAFGATAFAADDPYAPVQTAVPGAAGAQRAPLAFTGSDSTSSYVAVGAILVVIGAVLVIATVRRRRVPQSV